MLKETRMYRQYEQRGAVVQGWSGAWEVSVTRAVYANCTDTPGSGCVCVSTPGKTQWTCQSAVTHVVIAPVFGGVYCTFHNGHIPGQSCSKRVGKTNRRTDECSLCTRSAQRAADHLIDDETRATVLGGVRLLSPVPMSPVNMAISSCRE
jgi:hypothetical protein